MSDEPDAGLQNEADLAERIKQANRDVYNKVDPEEYNRNESIFNERRKRWCSNVLRRVSTESGNQSILDVGCGTGNLLRIAEDHFTRVVGLDIGDRLLAKVMDRFPDCLFTAGDAERLPFRDETFNCVSCNAVLHHLYEHERLLRECHRVLKKDGSLYTDHDPNYHFNRYYHALYSIWYRGRHGFGSATEDLAEYHHAHSPGIDPEAVSATLSSIGFKDVRVSYRQSDNLSFSGPKALALGLLRLASKWIPWRGLFTHFSIVARKS